VSNPTQEPTLEERLRDLRDAEERRDAASGEITALLPFVPQWLHSCQLREAYLRGCEDTRTVMAEEIAHLRACAVLDDATREAEARIAALEARVRELQAQPAAGAVGVVGEVRYGVEIDDGFIHRWIYSNEDSARAVSFDHFHSRIVAIVDPEAVVPLTSKEPVAWRDDDDGDPWRIRETALEGCRTTVTPLYPGLAQPAREES
jgi:hypothetical protein